MTAVLLAAALWTAGCAKNPVTGKKELVLISESQEIAYGREAHPEVLAQFGEWADPELQQYLGSIGERLAELSHRPRLPWHFTVVDVPVVNAFALPGGYIYVTREILAYMNSEAELAGVLGHEIGHVTARHAVSQISKAQLWGLGLGLGSLFSPTFRGLSELAQVGVGLMFLKHSRDDERQSDELGVRYMSRAGYDPRALSHFFQVFQDLQERQGALPSWLSSHPAPPERVRTTSALAAQVVAEETGREWRVGREEFLNRLTGLVFGENPREGYLEGGWFLHPDLRFRVRFPEGWRVINTRSAVLSSEPREEAVMRLSLGPQGQTPAQAARQLAARQGVQWLEGGNRRINGLEGFWGEYRVVQEGGELGMLALFLTYEGRLYQLLGLSPARLYRGYRSSFSRSMDSFSPLTDPRALEVRPDRLRLHRIRGGETLAELARRMGNPRADAEVLARLNRLPAQTPLQEGTLVKVVEPGRP